MCPLDKCPQGVEKGGWGKFSNISVRLCHTTPGQCQVVGNICIHLRSENELEVEGTTKRCVCAAKSYLIVSNIFRFSFPGAALVRTPEALSLLERNAVLSFFFYCHKLSCDSSTSGW